MEEVPPALKQAAVAQIVAGLINLTLMWWLAYVGLTLFCGVLTLGVGMFCGFGALILVPLGVLEIVAGLMVLTDAKGFVPLMRIVAMIEMASILMGSVVSVMVGGVVLSITNSEEVQYFLEG